MSRRFLFTALTLLTLLPALASAQAAPAAAEAPRIGVDYQTLETTVPPVRPVPGKIEVAEVFGYTCIHCAHFEPLLSQWKAKKMPAGAHLEYVPGVFGPPWDDFARAYYAAEKLKVLDKTHARVFKGVHEERAFQTGSLDEIADYYAKLGVDRAMFLATMQGADIDAKLDAARDYSTKVEVSGTPTLVIAGKYKLMATRDRGFEGVLATADFLIARELAAAKSAKPAKKKP
jgi:protein dithiol oxidoreductase (disulfide-forming)